MASRIYGSNLLRRIGLIARPEALFPGAHAARVSPRGAAFSTSAHQRRNRPPVKFQVHHEEFHFDPILLRDTCCCPCCKDPSTQQKLFQTSDIPPSIRGEALVSGNEDVSITWENDVPGYGGEHKSSYVVPQLRKLLQEPVRENMMARRIPWDRAAIEKKNKWIDFEQWVHSEKELYEGLKHLSLYGLLFIRNVPDDVDSFKAMIGRIGHLKSSFYGDYWHVESKQDAKNIAYTNQYLGLHMDLLYTTDPPHLQFLHSLRARASGGESMFSDSLHAAQKLWSSDRNLFNTLSTFQVPYKYDNDSQYYEYHRPTIEVNHSFSSFGPGAPPPLIENINWSPPFQGHFTYQQTTSIPSLKDYLTAARVFASLFESNDALFEHRLAEGECVIFDNRRVLHARRAFDASKGERRLRGGYVAGEVFFSKLRTLEKKHEPPQMTASR